MNHFGIEKLIICILSKKYNLYMIVLMFDFDYYDLTSNLNFGFV